MHCPRCKIHIFGGSICHICASTLIPETKAKKESTDAKPASDLYIGKKRKKLRSDLTQSLPSRFFTLLLEMAIFCAIFVAGTYAFMYTSDWLSDQMESKLWRFNPIMDGVVRNPIKYFWYVGCIIIVILTIKYRWHRDR